MLPSPGRDRLLPSKPGDEVGQELQQVDPSVIVSSTLAMERTEIIPFRFLLVFCEGNLLVFSFKVYIVIFDDFFGIHVCLCIFHDY